MNSLISSGDNEPNYHATIQKHKKYHKNTVLYQPFGPGPVGVTTVGFGPKEMKSARILEHILTFKRTLRNRQVSHFSGFSKQASIH